MTAPASGRVRPTGARRSWWLREALAAESAADPGLGSRDAAPPLRGTTTADVAIVGGGYTGLWTAIRIAEQAPGARVVLLESDMCGGGPSGRNGGFATGWWDELPTLIERHGTAGAVAAARAIDDAVDEIGRWSEANGVDAWYTKRGTLSVSAAPAQDGKWLEAVDACADAGFGDRYQAIDPADVRARVASPVLRGGAFMPVAATIQPAVLARGLRRVALELGVVIHEGTRVEELDGERPGWLGRLGSGGRQAPAGRTGRPVRIRTTSDDGRGEVIAGSVVVGDERLGGGVAELRPAPRDVVQLHRADRAHPGSPRGDRLDGR